jgi:hypothetical protein
VTRTAAAPLPPQPPVGGGAVGMHHILTAVLPDGTRDPVPVETRRDDGAAVELSGHGRLFAVVARWSAPAGPCGRRPVSLDVRCRADRPVEANLEVELQVGAAPDPHWLIPGLFYGENRPAECTRLYPRFAVGEHDPDQLVSAAWSFRADRAATPVVFGWGSTGGVAVATEEYSALGPSGLGFAHAGSVAAVRLVFPYREEPVSHTGDGRPAAPLAERYRWLPGEQVSLHFAVYLLGADRHGYAAVLRELHALSATRSPLRPWVGVAEAAALAAEGLYRWHYRPHPGVLVETVAFDRELNAAVGGLGDRQDMHVAWVSGIPYAAALLRHGRRVGRDDYVAAGAAVTDTVVTNLAPGGTFWGRWTAAGWRQSWTPVPYGVHGRTLAEATLFLLRAARAEEAHGVDRARWTAAARSNLDVAVAGQAPAGGLGSLFHALDGTVLSRAGTAGLTWVAALAEARDQPGGQSYLDAAVRAGEYYARFVDAEFLHGAPEDIDLGPSSEDGYAAVIAYIGLWRATGDRRHLDLARRAADWMLTFRYTYDVRFAPETLLGRYRFASRGADQASPSNQHLHAYGLVCLPEMVELARAVGDRHYLDRTRENLACFRQFIARVDGDFNARRGMAAERYYQTAGLQPKGMLGTLSHAWSVGMLLYGCEEALRIPELADPAGGADR